MPPPNAAVEPRTRILKHVDWQALLELLLLLGWTLAFSSAYLDMDPGVTLAGIEYGSGIQTFGLWERLLDCGTCALWYGQGGGSPALVDLHGSHLHPLVALSVLLVGMPNGAKLAVVAAFYMAGLAQWWLGRTLGLGPIVRWWCAALAVAAGHLAPFMDAGLPNLLIASAACALVLPALIQVAQRPGRRSVARLGLLGGLAILAGQAYLQIGMAFTLPALILLLAPGERLRGLARYAAAGVLAVMVAGIFLVPLAHFLPNFAKYQDAAFVSAQSLAHVPLNLVIGDVDFYHSELLGKMPYPGFYAYFLGWIPVLLALYASFRQGDSPHQGRLRSYLLAYALLALWISSAMPLRWIHDRVPIEALSDFVIGIRNPSVITTLAIPALIGLAGLGAEQLMRRPWHGATPRGEALLSRLRQVGLEPGFLVALPMLLALDQAVAFNQPWLSTETLDPEIAEVLDALETEDLQWVNPPYGRNDYIEPAVRRGLKVHTNLKPWTWEGHPSPDVFRQVIHESLLDERLPDGIRPYREVGAMTLWESEIGAHTYARVSGDVPCRAMGRGGHIDVLCDTIAGGMLTVQENAWTGWHAWVDETPAELIPGPQLSVSIPAGRVRVRFRYQPWDVALGLVSSLAGLAIVGWLWLKP